MLPNPLLGFSIDIPQNRQFVQEEEARRQWEAGQAAMTLPFRPAMSEIQNGASLAQNAFPPPFANQIPPAIYNPPPPFPPPPFANMQIPPAMYNPPSPPIPAMRCQEMDPSGQAELHDTA